MEPPDEKTPALVASDSSDPLDSLDASGEEPKVEAKALAGPPAAGGEPARQEPGEAGLERPEKVHRWRFRLAYLALAALLGVVWGGFFLFYDDGKERAQAAAWARFEPQGEGQAFFQSIADQVAASYRLDSSAGLAELIAAGPPSDDQGQPVAGVATIADAEATEPELVLDAQEGVEYALCSIGEECRLPIAETPAISRLARRAALELALYSLHYSNVSFVLVYLPAGADEDLAPVVLLRREDLEEQLARPLRETLAERTLTAASVLPLKEAALIDRLTMDKLFSFQFLEGQGGKIVLLAPYAEERPATKAGAVEPTTEPVEPAEP